MRLLLALVTALTVLHPAGARPEEPPPAYELELVSVFESSDPEFLFVIGNSGFRTVESVESFLATLPSGTTLKWSPAASVSEGSRCFRPRARWRHSARSAWSIGSTSCSCPPAENRLN